jgi:hypothetical protein
MKLVLIKHYAMEVYWGVGVQALPVPDGIEDCRKAEICLLVHWYSTFFVRVDRLCGLVVRVLGYRSGGPGSIPGTTRKKKEVVLERDPLSLVSAPEELLNRKVAAPV